MSSRFTRTAGTSWYVSPPVILALLGCLPPVLAQPQCEVDWQRGFHQDGTNRYIGATAVFDDGSGRALYAAGSFDMAGSVNADFIAKWDGAVWRRLNSGVDGRVRALVVFDDGSGPALYVGGQFQLAGGDAIPHIVKWDGANWSPLAGGTNGEVRSLAVHDDGGGPALYVGGTFDHAGAVAANNIAKWDGSAWSALGAGVSTDPGLQPNVRTITSFNDGNGRALYVGGSFDIAGKIRANRFAKWDGVTWSAIEGELSRQRFGVSVAALHVFDDGDGDALYVGGSFDHAGGVEVVNIARWDGESWSPLGLGVRGGSGGVLTLTVFDDGNGSALFVGGRFNLTGGTAVDKVARWNGQQWSALNGGIRGDSVSALTAFDDGSGRALYATGEFTSTRDVLSRNIARWNGQDWSRVGDGDGVDDVVRAFTTFDDGDGEALFVGGSFTSAGGVPLSLIGKWDGVSWSPLGLGVDDTQGDVLVLMGFDDGTGPALYVGGEFQRAGGVAIRNIAKWDGTQWLEVGGQMDRSVRAFAVYDDGAGEALYAAGNLRTANGVPANHIARWDGLSWSALGDGTDGTIAALEVFDDGGGAALYAVGRFATAGGAATNHIAKWDGNEWTPLGTGLRGSNASAHALAVYDDDNGPALYVGGRFTIAGDRSASGIARWDGAIWADVGGGVDDSIVALKVYDDGEGPALYAGGNFTRAGGVDAERIAKWDGRQWAPLGLGVSSSVATLEVFDDGSGPGLFVGGWLQRADQKPASRMAKWGCDPPPCDPCDANCDGLVDAFDIEPFLDLLFGGAVPCEACAGDANGDGEMNAFDIEPFLDCLFP